MIFLLLAFLGAQCPSYYYYNSSAGACTPQIISSACPPNYPDSPVYFTCGGSTDICAGNSNYTFTGTQCILVSSPSKQNPITAIINEILAYLQKLFFF